MSIWMNFFDRLAPGLALAVRQQPVEARADQHHDVGLFQHRRARRARALRMRVGQQALGHAHRQERNAALFDERADRVVGLRVGRALAENDQRALGALEHIERALDGGRSGKLRRRRIDDLDERLGASLRVHHLAEKLWPADRDRRRPDGRTPRRGSRAPRRCRCRLACSTRNAALHSGLAMASWSISS
jgi:hypothetical protein